jgi:4-aminobutyrate aminotransferase-like enzyme
MTTFAPADVSPGTVHDVLRRSILVDGFDMVLDLTASRGSRLVDARDGTSYLDLFTFFASSALGMNHPGLTEDPLFREELLTAAMNKPSNSDVYTEAMARFVSTFARVLGDPSLPHLFFVEGGDHHFRPEYLQALQRLAHQHDALLVLDEVQSGAGITGTAWAFQQLGVQPDVVAFGKKTQVCGVMAGGRVDEVPDNVFATSSRINSTWGGSLTDMVRARRILEVVEADGLIARAKALEPVLLGHLEDLAVRHPEVSDVRGRGLMCAFSLPDTALRDAVLTSCRDDERVLLLGCGTRSVRFRPALTVTPDELAEGVAALDRALTRKARS